MEDDIESNFGEIGVLYQSGLVALPVKGVTLRGFKGDLSPSIEGNQMNYYKDTFGSITVIMAATSTLSPHSVDSSNTITTHCEDVENHYIDKVQKSDLYVMFNDFKRKMENLFASANDYKLGVIALVTQMRRMRKLEYRYYMEFMNTITSSFPIGVDHQYFEEFMKHTYITVESEFGQKAKRELCELLGSPADSVVNPIFNMLSVLRRPEYHTPQLTEIMYIAFALFVYCMEKGIGCDDVVSFKSFFTEFFYSPEAESETRQYINRIKEQAGF